MVFTHAAVGSLLTKRLTRNRKLAPKHLSVVYFVGIVAAILPDLDIVALIFNTSLRHRHFITHSFIPYIAVIILGFLYAFIRKSYFLKNVVGAFTLGVFSHLIVDYFYGGIVALSPINKNVYGYAMKLSFDNRYDWAVNYFTSKFLIGEFIILVLFLVNLKSIKNKVGRYLPIFFVFISLVMLAVITFI